MYSQSILTRLAYCCALFAAAALLTSVGCSDDDTTGSASCTFDSDCVLGQVCGAGDICVSAPCSDCENDPDRICYVTEENPQGTCSFPECDSDSECADKGGSCIDGVCTDQECGNNEDCGSNEICNFAGQCVESNGTCQSGLDCPTGQVCTDEGRCRPGCSANEECDESEYCDMASNTCQPGCRGNDDCASTQTCTDNRCVCTDGTCGAGQFCNMTSGNCETAMNCDQISCPDGQVCDSNTLGCVEPCTMGSCMAGQVCNTATGECVVDNCVGEDPGQCAGNPVRSQWDPVNCFCAECISNSDCNEAAGETCNESGSCFACQTPCDSMVPGTCAGETPYCSDSCCIECIGVADCAQGELCLDGFCGAAPDCSSDPSICPAGTTCQAGQCQAEMTGQSCSAMDPLSCPPGQFCDPSSNSCVGAGGGMNCGLCNPDCTCDNGLTCDGFLCNGCSGSITDLQGDCPSGTVCLAAVPLLNGPALCFPNPFG